MSTQSYNFNKPVAWTVDGASWVNVSPPGEPPVYGAKSYHSGGEDIVVGWYGRNIITSVKTPRPWPNDDPSQKQWNPFWKTESKTLNDGGSVFYNRTIPTPGTNLFETRTGTLNRCFSSVAEATSDLVPNDDLALQKVLQKIKAQDWNVAECVGEMQQTVGLVVNTMTKIANAISAVKKGNVRKAMTILNVAAQRGLGPAQKRAINRKHRTKKERDAASAWLTINYGVIPLIDDVRKAVQNLQNRLEWPVIVSASHTERRVSTRQGSCLSTVGGPGRYTSVTTRTCTSRYVLQYVVDVRYLAYIRSLGLTNMPSLAWELTPGSLIVDWFLPVGTWLSNMDATLGLIFVRGSLSQKTTTLSSVTATCGGSDAVGSWNGSASRNREVVEKKRSSLSSFPTPGLPQFKNPLSAQHAANGLAFLVTAFHR